jgi:hypothetical protein
MTCLLWLWRWGLAFTLVAHAGGAIRDDYSSPVGPICGALALLLVDGRRVKE